MLPLILAVSAAATVSAKPKWEPVNPADLAATDSTSVPGADSEVLFSRHTLDSMADRTYMKSHVRAKIYTTKGVERLSVFSIEYARERKVIEVAARVVKPDGTATELGKADLRESAVFKKRGFEIQRLSFAFPNVQPGDVIEYRWHQPMGDFGYYKIFCQMPDVPTREFVFDVESSATDYNVTWFNCKVERDQPNGRKITIRDLPPFIEEPLMPAETEFRSWIMLVFSHPFLRWYSAEDAWDLLGDYLADEFKSMTAPRSAIRNKAAELVAGATSDEDKIERLYHFTQASIRNLDWDASPEFATARRKRDDRDSDQSPGETLSSGSGNRTDIDHLFASLARAAGFEVRVAMSADRDEILNINTPKGWIMAYRRSVAVKLGNDWRFYTPGNALVPCNLLGTKDAGAMVYVCDEKKCWWATAPISTPAQTLLRRTGRFTLDAEGTLQGEVTLEMTGHRAINARDAANDRSHEERVTAARERLAERLPTAEISEARWENVGDVSLPLIVRYAVTVPGYAEAIGSRLSFPLNFFTAHSSELFTNEVRRYPIFFEFAESQHDDVELILPEGFALEGASAPAPVGTEENPLRARYDVKYSGKTRKLTYQRTYVLGEKSLTYQAKSYPALRTLLGKVHRSDSHQLIIKPKAVAAPAEPAATPANPTPTAP